MWLLIFLLMTGTAIADDYVCQVDGKITAKYQSVDPVVMGLDQREGCFAVSRDKLQEIDQYYKFDGGIFSDKPEDKIIPLSAEEKQAILDEQEVKEQEHAQVIQSTKDKLKAQGFDDKEIDFIVGFGF